MVGSARRRLFSLDWLCLYLEANSVYDLIGEFNAHLRLKEEGADPDMESLLGALILATPVIKQGALQIYEQLFHRLQKASLSSPSIARLLDPQSWRRLHLEARVRSSQNQPPVLFPTRYTPPLPQQGGLVLASPERGARYGNKCCRFTPDGKRLVFIDDNGRATVCHSETCEKLANLECTLNKDHKLFFSGDGAEVIA